MSPDDPSFSPPSSPSSTPLEPGASPPGRSSGPRLGCFVQLLLGGLGGVCLLVGFLYAVVGSQSAQQGDSAVRSAREVVVEGTAVDPDPALDGELVHVTGPLRGAVTLVDPDFGLRSRGTFLERRVEVYQWDQVGSGSSRRWEKQWDTFLGSGGSTNYRNPEEKALPDRTLYPEILAVGDLLVLGREIAYPGSGALAPSGPPFEDHLVPVPVPARRLPGGAMPSGTMPAEAERSRPAESASPGVEAEAGTETEHSAPWTWPTTVAGLVVHPEPAENRVFLGTDPGAPEIGDLRISWWVLDEGHPVSVVGHQVAGPEWLPVLLDEGRTVPAQNADPLGPRGPLTAQAVSSAELIDNGLLAPSATAEASTRALVAEPPGTSEAGGDQGLDEPFLEVQPGSLGADQILGGASRGNWGWLMIYNAIAAVFLLFAFLLLYAHLAQSLAFVRHLGLILFVPSATLLTLAVGYALAATLRGDIAEAIVALGLVGLLAAGIGVLARGRAAAGSG